MLQIHIFHTQSEMKQTITLKWVWWWDTMNAPGKEKKKRNQFYWSAICGTNSTATLPSCLMDSQIPGMSWHPVAINSMHHFNYSENYAPTASTVNVPKTWMKHEYSVHIAMKRYGFWRVKGDIYGTVLA